MKMDELRTYYPGVWNDWTGGEPPVKDWHTLVDVERRDGDHQEHRYVGAFNWGWEYGRYGPDDIVRFRLIVEEVVEVVNPKPKKVVSNKEPSKAFIDNCDFGDSTLREDFEAKYESSSGSHSASMPGSEQEEHGGRNA